MTSHLTEKLQQLNWIFSSQREHPPEYYIKQNIKTIQQLSGITKFEQKCVFSSSNFVHHRFCLMRLYNIRFPRKSYLIENRYKINCFITVLFVHISLNKTQVFCMIKPDVIIWLFIYGIDRFIKIQLFAFSLKHFVSLYSHIVYY